MEEFDVDDDPLHRELASTLDYQVERLQEIDSKALEILKANLLLIGIFVTGVSILVQTGVDVSRFLNLFTAFAGLLLLTSTALAGVTYTSSNVRGGLDGPAVDRALTTSEEFTRELAESYRAWIEYNADVTAVNDLLVTVTVLLVVDSFVFLLAGLVSAVAGAPFAIEVAAFLLLVAAVAWMTRLAYNMDHVDQPDAEPPPFEGVKISKGRTRDRGFEALVRMLRSGEERERTEDE